MDDVADSLRVEAEAVATEVSGYAADLAMQTFDFVGQQGPEREARAQQLKRDVFEFVKQRMEAHLHV